MTPRRWSELGEVYLAPPVAPSHRSFGLTVGGILVAIAAFAAWRGHLLRAAILAGIGSTLVLAALTVPVWLKGPALVWGRIGHALGWFNSRVLLTVMFALILSPAALLSRLFGVDLLDTRRRTGSWWFAYSQRSRDPKHFERLF